MIVLYKGRRGAGKSLTMVKDGYQYYLNGYRVLANFQCTFAEYISNEDLVKLNKESDIDKCVIMLDELQIFFDSRRSMRNQNMNFSYFVAQIRKRGVILLCATQYTNTVDLRLRQHLDIIAMPKYIEEFKLCEVTYIDLTSLEDNWDNTFAIPDSIKVVFEAESIFGLYDTTEMIA